ncbi:MAG: type I-C CRISPR-associated protein Cas5c [Bryobacteraceae bacterium]
MAVEIKVFGDYACFSRPEFKVERVSYPLITPSAARGILEAVFWKPEIRYQIREIHVLRLGTQVSVLRNEISDWQGAGPLVAQDSRQRQQRTSLVLRNVAYVIRSDIVLREHTKDEIGKYLDCFNRRVKKGQCHHTPCLGTREFAASFEAPTPDERGGLAINLDIGQMLFDMAFIEAPNGPGDLEFFKPGSSGQRRVKGRAESLFFHACVIESVLKVPADKYRELYRLEDGHA